MPLLTLLSWNMNQQPSNWDNVLASGADAALLQEAKPPPPQLKNTTAADFENDWLRQEISWCAAVVGLSDRIKFTPVITQPLGSLIPETLKVSRPSAIAAAIIRILDTGEDITIVSLYSTWETPLQGSWIYADASAHRLISDLSVLIGTQKNHKIIAAGDLNILYGYGEYGSSYWKRRYDTVFDRFSALGLRFIGPQAPEGGVQASPWPAELPKESRNVPTFRTNKNKPETANRQLDFIFASESIADRLSVKAANSIEEWGPSDHCRVFIHLDQ